MRLQDKKLILRNIFSAAQREAMKYIHKGHSEEDIEELAIGAVKHAVSKRLKGALR